MKSLPLAGNPFHFDLKMKKNLIAENYFDRNELEACYMKMKCPRGRTLQVQIFYVYFPEIHAFD